MFSFLIAFIIKKTFNDYCNLTIAQNVLNYLNCKLFEIFSFKMLLNDFFMEKRAKL